MMIFATAQEIRGQQSESPVELSAAYTADLLANLRGGNDTGTRYMDNLDIDLTLDMDALAGLPSSTVYLYGLGNQGGSISELAGDVQGISNIETENSWRLYEARYLHQLPSIQSSLLLMVAAACWGHLFFPTLRGVVELEQPRFVLGCWMYTEPRSFWLEEPQREYGVYVTAESKLYHDGEANRGLAGFLRLGIANDAVNQFFWLYRQWTCVQRCVCRPKDQLGLSVAVPRNSDEYQRFAGNNNGQPADYEMNVEATYLLLFSNYIQIQADMQYVINPGASQAIDNTFVTGFRTIFSF